MMPVSSLLACFLTYVRLWTMAAENIQVIQWGWPEDLGRALLGWQHLLRPFKVWLFSSSQHVYSNASVVLWFLKPPDWESKHLHVKPRIYDKNTYKISSLWLKPCSVGIITEQTKHVQEHSCKNVCFSTSLLWYCFLESVLITTI